MNIQYRADTREDWLNKAVELLRPMFENAGHAIPDKVHVSIGFTGSRQKKAVGACWSEKASEDNRHQIYIVPTLKGETVILAILIHECCHAALGIEVGHKKPFQALMTRLGMVAPFTQCNAGEALQAKLEELATRLGPIPHPQLSQLVGDKKKQTTRLRLYQCQCPKPVKVRVASDDFNATCNECGCLFEQPEQEGE